MFIESGKHIVPLAVIMVVIGLVLGWSSAGTELLNPQASAAAAAQVAVDTAYTAEKNTIDLDYYRQERVLETQAAAARYNNDIQTYQAMNAAKVSVLKFAGYVGIGLSAYFLMLIPILYFWHRFQVMVQQKEEAANKTAPRRSEQPLRPLTPVYLRPQPVPAHNRNGNGRIPHSGITTTHINS